MELPNRPLRSGRENISGSDSLKETNTKRGKSHDNQRRTPHHRPRDRSDSCRHRDNSRRLRAGITEQPSSERKSNQSPHLTPKTIIIYQDNTPVAIQMKPVPLTPYVLIDNLRRESTEYEATKEATTNAGRSADTMEDPIRKIFITVDSLERSDEVATFLASRSVAISSKNENPSYAEFVVVAYVPRSLLKELSYMEGITRIESFPGPSNG